MNLYNTAKQVYFCAGVADKTDIRTMVITYTENKEISFGPR